MKGIYKIKRPPLVDLIMFFIALVFYLLIVNTLSENWNEFKSKLLAVIPVILGGLYFITYLSYIFSNRIEINRENMELREKLLNLSLYRIDINDIQEVRYELPRKGALVRNSWMWPNYLETAHVYFVISGRNVKKKWIIGKANVDRIIKELRDINRDIIKNKVPPIGFFTKKRNNIKLFLLLVISSLFVLGILLYIMGYLMYIK